MAKWSSSFAKIAAVGAGAGVRLTTEEPYGRPIILASEDIAAYFLFVGK